MIAALVCDRDDKEREALLRDCRRQVAESCEEELRLEEASDDSPLQAAGAELLVNLLYYDFQGGQSVEALRSFRRTNNDACVMLVTDAAVSPLEYLRPGVAPDSLVFRPLDEERLKERNREFVENYLERIRNHETDDSFLVETREEKVRIPYSQIYYFEAREKKLYVRTLHEEYSFYDTIEALAARLPEGFQRCHRSYIVNMSRIRKLVSTENYLELDHQLGVPVSRGNKLRILQILQKTGETAKRGNDKTPGT